MNNQHLNIKNQLDQLNNRINYQNSNQTHLLLTLKNATDISFNHYQLHINTINREIIRAQPKSIYIALKWFNFLHAALQIVKSCLMAEVLTDLLQKIEFSKNSKYEQYLEHRLVRPYQKYLKKLGELTVLRLAGPSPNKQNESNCQIYGEFNILEYSCRQFIGPASQFVGYFNTFYPCLNNYISLLGRDMQKFYKKVRLAYQRQSEEIIKYLQIQKMENSISFFTNYHSNNDRTGWILTETDAKSEQVSPNNRSNSEHTDTQQQYFQLGQAFTEKFVI